MSVAHVISEAKNGVLPFRNHTAEFFKQRRFIVLHRLLLDPV